MPITFYTKAFIIIYVIYLLFALSGQAINSRLRGEYPIEVESSVNESPTPSDEQQGASQQEELE